MGWNLNFFDMKSTLASNIPYPLSHHAMLGSTKAGLSKNGRFNIVQGVGDLWKQPYVRVKCSNSLYLKYLYILMKQLYWWYRLWYSNYSLYSFEIRRDVISGRLRTSLRVTIKRTYFAAIPYTMWVFHGTLPAWNTQSTGSDITSYLEAVQTVFLVDIGMGEVVSLYQW